MGLKMILSDKKIFKIPEDKTLIIEPPETKQIQPASVDIRLGNTFCIVEDSSTGIINLENNFFNFDILTVFSFCIYQN